MRTRLKMGVTILAGVSAMGATAIATTSVAFAANAGSAQRSPAAYYPSVHCGPDVDGKRIVGADSQIWECTHDVTFWYWYPTGIYIT